MPRPRTPNQPVEPLPTDRHSTGHAASSPTSLVFEWEPVAGDLARPWRKHEKPKWGKQSGDEDPMRRAIILRLTVRRGSGVTDRELRRSINHEIAFLRMAAIELRRIAERAPEVADELRHIANQFEADAEELGKRFAGPRGA